MPSVARRSSLNSDAVRLGTQVEGESRTLDGETGRRLKERQIGISYCRISAASFKVSGVHSRLVPSDLSSSRRLSGLSEHVRGVSHAEVGPGSFSSRLLGKQRSSPKGFPHGSPWAGGGDDTCKLRMALNARVVHAAHRQNTGMEEAVVLMFVPC